MIPWIKTHKLVVVLLLLLFFLGWNYFRAMFGLGYSSSTLTMPSMSRSNSGFSSLESGLSAGKALDTSFNMPPFGDYDRVSNTQDRIVIQDSTLSLVVTDVRETGNQILSYTKNNNGFMVNSSYSSPNESPYAQITVRIPTERLEAALAHFRSLAVKVSSENLVGTDVTDRYQDLEAQLKLLETTKTKFEEILTKATAVQDILTVQRELISNQQQIDSVTGQKMALSDNAKLTKVTLFLSSDELSLPYVPDTSFRPSLIFKQSVRSLVNTFRLGAELLIWTGVYAVVWVPLLIGYLAFMRYRKQLQKKSP